MLNRTPSPSLTDPATAADDTIDMRLTAIIYGGDGTNLFEFRTLDGQRRAAVLRRRARGREPAERHHPPIFDRELAVRPHALSARRETRGERPRRLALPARAGARRQRFEDRPAAQQLPAERECRVIGLHRRRHRHHADPLHDRPADRHSAAISSCTTRCACAPRRCWRRSTKPDERISLHVDGEQDGRLLDIAAIVAAAAPDAELYCCGPAPMLAAFEAACASRPPAARASGTLQRAGQCCGDRRRLHRRACEIEAQHHACSRARRCCRRCRMRD